MANDSMARGGTLKSDSGSPVHAARRPRVLIAGLFHETHTFLDGTTPLQAFRLRRGEELLEARGDGSPLSGVLEVADGAGWDLRPVVDLRATPGAVVDDAVLETFWREFRAAADTEALAGPPDGVFLVLHGAMVCQSERDVEGAIVEGLRRLPGLAHVPICGVLDLHGNISRRLLEAAQGFLAYRENPHTDARAAAVDAARLLDRTLATDRPPVCVREQPPVMWPPTGTATAEDPLRTLEALAREIESRHPEIAAVNVMAGFSFADTEATGVSFSAVTFGDPDVARRELRRLAEWTVENRQLGSRLDRPLTDVIHEIQRRADAGAGPILIVEPADNVGGGAPGDGTTVLRMLIEAGIENAAVVINDPAAVAELHSAPTGAHRRLSIGGRGSQLTDGPLELEVELLSTSDGRFDLEDPHSHLASMSGVHIDMGPCAVVRHAGVRILLTSRKTPPFDLGQLRSQGLEPERLSVIGVKAAVAHRRAYEKIARASYTVATPGPCTSDLRSLPFEHVRRPIYPLDD
jgi:microcystin degradation protein MlrC